MMICTIPNVNASDKIFAFPGEDMTDEFRFEVFQVIKKEVESLKKGDNVYFLSDTSLTMCELSGTGNLRRNLAGIEYISSKSKNCHETLNALRFNSTSNKKNSVNIPKLMNTILGNTDKDSDFKLFIFGSPLYYNTTYQLNFERGYPSLGYLNRETSMFVSPFIPDYNVNFNEQKVNVIYPRNEKESRYVTDISKKGQLQHYNKIRSFYNEYFHSIGMKLSGYNDISEGILKNSIFIQDDKDYLQSKNDIYFVDMVTLGTPRHKNGEKEVLISSYNEVIGDTQTVYSYSLKQRGIPDKIYLKEFDGDSDRYPGIRIKIVLANSDGTSEVFKLVPSKDDEWKEHWVKNISSMKDVVSISIYPIDRNGNFQDFNGAWSISNLEIYFK